MALNVDTTVLLGTFRQFYRKMTQMSTHNLGFDEGLLAELREAEEKLARAAVNEQTEQAQLGQIRDATEAMRSVVVALKHPALTGLFGQKGD